ncbi:MAG: thioredoxin family protein [Nanoarchaeota archaeon]
MIKVQILTTPDCTGCAIVEKMLDEMKIKYEIIDVTKKPEFLKKYPIMAAPGIVINGKLEFAGVPNKAELKKKLKLS